MKILADELLDILLQLDLDSWELMDDFTDDGDGVFSLTEKGELLLDKLNELLK